VTVTVEQLAERALRRLGVAIVPVALRPALVTVVPADDLATRALVALTVIASDETPSATDQALALSKVQAVHDGMVAQGYVSWTADAVPQAASEEYTLLAALHLAQAFGKAGDPSQQPVIEARVRKIALLLGEPDHAAGVVRDVHMNLAARGLVRWSLDDIPPAAEDPYVMMACSNMAPEYGLPEIKGDNEQAMRAFAQIIALPSSGERTPAEYF
jgi:hypothetical protein